jgi:FkbM family methyltransferase
MTSYFHMSRYSQGIFFAVGVVLGIVLTIIVSASTSCQSISSLYNNHHDFRSSGPLTTGFTAAGAQNVTWDPRGVIHKGHANLGRFGVDSNSQVGQDETVMRILDNKREGYFVDCAANDAVVHSNTLALETRLGWTGLCIEPNPYYHGRFRDRRCTLVEAVAGGKDGEVVKFMENWGLGGIVGFDNTEDTGSVEVLAVSLETIFDKLNVPSVIDYFSLDIEGAELHVMENFPFHRYKFHVITVERPRHLRTLLEQHDYVYVMDHGSFGDKLYVHKSIPNFEQVMRKFGTKPKALSETLSATSVSQNFWPW